MAEASGIGAQVAGSDALGHTIEDDARQKLSRGVASLEGALFVEVAEVQLAQDRVQHLRGAANVDHDAVRVKLGPAQLQVDHVGRPVHALRRAEDLALKAVRNHEMVADVDGVHGSSSHGSLQG